MVQTFSCDSENCGRVFTKAYELKKHKATHDNPESVFHCPQCEFITLQKKSLVIHIALHTGEKGYQCPDLVMVSPREPPVPCEYKTHDPAALSKHRKRIHDYVPPPNRTGPKSPRDPLETKDDNVTQPRRSPRSHTPSYRRPKMLRALRAPENSNGTASVTNPSPLRNEIIDVEVMNADGEDAQSADLCDLFDLDEETCFDSFFDPTLSPCWMAEYEETYTNFGPHFPKLLKGSPSVLDGFDMDTGRNACFCPEWMGEAGVEGWCESVAEDAQELEVS